MCTETRLAYFLDFFPQVLLISVHARMRVQFEGGNNTRAGSILLGSACSLECYNTRSSLLPAMSAAVLADISAVASAAIPPGFTVH